MNYHIVLFNKISDSLLEGYRFCSFEDSEGKLISPPFELPRPLEEITKLEITLDPKQKLRCTGFCSDRIDHETNLDVSDKDFMLLLRNFPRGPAIRIPFYNGDISDEGSWRESSEPIYGQVRKVVEHGYLVSIQDVQALMPLSLVNEQERINPLMKIFQCEVIYSDGVRSPCVRPIGPFISFEEHYPKLR